MQNAVEKCFDLQYNKDVFFLKIIMPTLYPRRHFSFIAETIHKRRQEAFRYSPRNIQAPWRKASPCRHKVRGKGYCPLRLRKDKSAR